MGWNCEESPSPWSLLLDRRAPLSSCRLAIIQRPRFGLLSTVNILLLVVAVVFVAAVFEVAIAVVDVVVVAAAAALRHLFL